MFNGSFDSLFVTCFSVRCFTSFGRVFTFPKFADDQDFDKVLFLGGARDGLEGWGVTFESSSSLIVPREVICKASSFASFLRSGVGDFTNARRGFFFFDTSFFFNDSLLLFFFSSFSRVGSGDPNGFSSSCFNSFPHLVAPACSSISGDSSFCCCFRCSLR